MTHKLFDNYQRIHDYLRISLTDNCNFRCTYCMPDEKISCLPPARLMQCHEILEIASVFVKLGVQKIRLTGGEPLLRKDFSEIINGLVKLPVHLTMTTNGFLMDKYISTMLQQGILSVNVSLDTLNPEKFFAITKRDYFQKVWDNIHLMTDQGMNVKINVVLMKNINEDEVFDFIEWTKNQNIHVRFIEFMPFDKNDWQQEKVVRFDQVMSTVYQEFDVVKLIDEKHDTAKKFKVVGYQGTFAFITTMSQPFCGDCNRMRLTADGKIKNCLFGKDELDLLTAFRNGENIETIIRHSLSLKHRVMGGQFEESYLSTKSDQIQNRSMIKIGG